MSDKTTYYTAVFKVEGDREKHNECYSDMLDLAETIAYWLEQHMRPEA